MSIATATERGILFSAPMVRAILDGSKTQTRRVVKPPRGYDSDQMGTVETNGLVFWDGHGHGGQDSRDRCQLSPYGQPGDLLYVRETWRWYGRDRGQGREGGLEYRADGVSRGFDSFENPDAIWCVFSMEPEARLNRWRPSIHMPKAFSRLWLRITDVRVERVQEITNADAIAEGMTKRGVWWDAGPNWEGDGAGETPVEAFAQLWDSINSKRSPWSDNPWVFAVSFEKVEK